MDRKPAMLLRAASGIVMCGLIMTLYLFVSSAATGDLGDIAHYNGLIFNEFVAHQADVEGALAVGGRSRIGTTGQYDVGASHASVYYPTVQIGVYENPYSYPTLLLGNETEIGRTSGTNYINIYGGPVIMSRRAQSAYENSRNKFYIQQGGAPIFQENNRIDTFFAETYKTVTHTSNVLTHANDSAITLSQFLAGSQYGDVSQFGNQYLTGGGNLRIICINVTATGYVEINSPRIPTSFQQYDLIVFNFPNAASVRFTGGSLRVDSGQINTSAPAGAWPDQHALLKTFAERVVWNFPNAESIQITSCGVVGSVLAPEADLFANGGSINGMLIADGFETTGGMELHAFRLNKGIFDLDTDHDIFGDVEFVKVDTEDDRILSGAEFELQKKENGVYTAYNTGSSLITDNRGRLQIYDLPEGEYRLVEIAAPPGYEILTQGFEFVIDEDHGVYEPLVYILENRQLTTDIRLYKKDAADQTLLSGAVFTLLEFRSGRFYEIGDVISDQNGELYLTGLSEGTYHLVEVVPPEGYDAFTGSIIISVTLDSQGSPVAEAWYGNTLLSGKIIPNNKTPVIPPDPGDPEPEPDPLYRVLFTKEDAYMGMTLAGAEFDLDRLENGQWNNISSGLTTDAYGFLVIDNLEEGHYRLVETRAPEGYQVNYNNNNQDNVINEKTYYIKEFHVPDVAVIPLRLGVSGTLPLGISGGIPIGISGDLPLGVSGTVAYDQSYIHYTLYNKPDGKFTATKKDSDGKPLAGAEFRLYFAPDATDPDNLYRVRDGLISDENGIVTLQSLPPGHYVLQEVKPPDGYMYFPSISLGASGQNMQHLLPPTGVIHFVVDASNQYHAEFDVEDPSYSGEVILQKTDADNPGILLAGAEFDLYFFESGTRQWVKISSGITDQNGRLRQDNLTIGIYKLVETKAPPGYGLDEEFGGNERIFTITPEFMQRMKEGEETMVNLGVITIPNSPVTGEPDGSVELIKVDAVDFSPLQDAVFHLYKKDAGGQYWRYRAYLHTDENGILQIDGLKEGDYLLSEARAPTGYELNTNPIYFSLQQSGNSMLQLDPIVFRNSKTGTTPPGTEGPDPAPGPNPDKNRPDEGWSGNEYINDPKTPLTFGSVSEPESEELPQRPINRGNHNPLTGNMPAAVLAVMFLLAAGLAVGWNCKKEQD